MNCVFCSIIARELSAKIIAENDDLIVIPDRSPKADIHYLIISKKHVTDIQSLEAGDRALGEKIFTMAQDLARRESRDFRFVINSGRAAGQCVFHLHAHFLAGKIHESF